MLASLVTLEKIFRSHFSFLNAASVLWDSGPCSFFVLFFSSFLSFMPIPIYHSKKKNRMWRQDLHIHSWKTTCMHTQSFSKVLLLFYLPYSTCFRQSAPTRLEWILSRPFRFSASDALMKGDSTIWTDQVAAGSAQRRAKHGDTPLHGEKRQVNHPLIYPLPLSLIPCRPWQASVYVCVCFCVHLSVCVCWALIELFMTGLIGLIEDIKITCQLCVSRLPFCLTTPDKWGTP